MDIPRTNAPFCVHQPWTLTGNDCIEISQALEKLRAQGVDSTDSRYATLLSIFNFIVQYQAQRTKIDEQNRQREQTNNGSLFTPQQYSQFIVQIRCLKHLLERKPLPPQLITSLKHFSNNSNIPVSVPNEEKSWELSPAEKEKEKEKQLIKTIVERMRDPSTTLVDTINEEFRPVGLDLNTLKIEQKRLMNLKMNQRKSTLKARMEEFKKTGQDIPLPLRKELRALDLIDFQQTLRVEVSQAIPLQDIRSNRFRSRKEVELIRKARDRKEKKS